MTSTISVDSLSTLPTDKIHPSHTDIELVNQLFPSKPSCLQTICLNIQDTLLVGIIIYLFGIPNIDIFLKTTIPFTRTSNYKLFLIKSLLAMSLYYIITTFILKK